MADDSERNDGQPKARGDAAWKEVKQRVADRNEAASKAAKTRRAAFQLQRDAARRRAR